MTISITLNGFRTWQANGDDIDRARLAAEASLALSGVSAEMAYAAYVEQWQAFEDESLMTDAAWAWCEAHAAADVALTAGWAKPGADVFCEMTAE